MQTCLTRNVSVGIFAADYDAERILLALTRAGFKLFRVFGAVDKMGFELSFKRRGVQVDLFTMFVTLICVIRTLALHDY